MIRGDFRIAAGYLTYFATVGIIQPYLPLELAALGYSAAAIGVLLALWNGARIAGPLAAAWLADRQPDRRRLLAPLALASALFTALLAAVTSAPAVALVLVLQSFCFNGLIPVYDAHAIERLGATAHRYGWFRLWGSIGFVLAATLAGYLTEDFGTVAIRAALVAFAGATALAFIGLPGAAHTPQAAIGLPEFVAALREPRLQRFLLVCFLHLAGFGGYYSFYSLYLLRAGYGTATVGLLWASAVVAEIALFAVGPRLLARYPLSQLLRVALASTVLRWVLVAAYPQVPMLQFGAQLLHLAGFGLFHSVTVLLGPALLPGGAQARAQALVSSLGWGAGGMAGSLMAGFLWDRVGPRAVFIGSALVAAGAWMLALRAVHGPAGPDRGSFGPRRYAPGGTSGK